MVDVLKSVVESNEYFIWFVGEEKGFYGSFKNKSFYCGSVEWMKCLGKSTTSRLSYIFMEIFLMEYWALWRILKVKKKISNFTKKGSFFEKFDEKILWTFVKFQYSSWFPQKTPLNLTNDLNNLKTFSYFSLTVQKLCWKSVGWLQKHQFTHDKQTNFALYSILEAKIYTHKD